MPFLGFLSPSLPLHYSYVLTNWSVLHFMETTERFHLGPVPFFLLCGMVHDIAATMAVFYRVDLVEVLGHVCMHGVCIRVCLIVHVCNITPHPV